MDRNKTIYESRKAAGICVHCRRKPASPGHVICADCAAWMREYRNKLAAGRKASNQCIDCGSELKPDERLICGICRKIRSNRRHSRLDAGVLPKNRRTDTP